jgi:hypothetical protein
MKLGVILLAAVAVIGAGCSTLNHSQYQVKGPVNNVGVRGTVSAADRAVVKEIANAVAAQFKLKDMTTSSVVPGTIGYYTEIDVNNPVEVKVYSAGDQVVVDVMQADSAGETRAFRQIKEALQSELESQFGSRLVIAPFKTLEQSPHKIQTPRSGR